MKRISTILLSIIAGTFACLAQNSLSVEAPNVVSMDETFRVVFTADGKISDFSWPATDDFTIAWGPQKGSMSSVNIVNGKRTSTHQETYSYLLQPKKEGRFTLPGATATVEKNSVSSRSFTIEVVASAAQAQSAQSQQPQNQQQSQPQQQSDQQSAAQTGTVSGQDIFLRMSVSKTSVVKGEPLIATLKLYTRTDITGFEDVRFPTFDGFWSKELDTPQNIEFNRENVGGTIYNAALIRRYMLIPQRTGSVSIDPAEMVCQIRVRTSNGAPRSIFDDFFDSYQTIRKRLSTPEIKVNVRALPAGAPASFGGGVGNFSMSAKVSKDDLKSNEAASLVVTITGKGNISMLEAPKVSFPPDFEVYDLKTTEKVSSDGTTGTRTFEFPFIPRSHGDFTIEPVQYSYYSLEKGRYETLTTDAIEIHIEKGSDVDGGGVVMPGVTRQGVRDLAQDVRFIHTGNPSLRQKDSFFAGSGLFYGLAAAVVALFFIVSALIKSALARRKDVVGSRNRKANKMARARLKQAGDYLHGNLPSAYYEELHKAMLGYVSDKLSMPASDLSKEKISEELASRGVSASTSDELISIIDACEFARYAPNAEMSEMENQYNNAVKVISDLESQIKGASRQTRRSASAAAVVALLMLGTLHPATSSAAGTDDLWNAANEAFAAGQWQQALESYQAIEQQGMVSTDLYYNIGNTFFKLDDNPRAILYYERALKADPSNVDAKNNLEMADQYVMDKIEAVPEFLLATAFNKVKYAFGADAWAWIAIALLVVTAALMLGFRFFGTVSARRTSFVLACVALLLALLAFIFSLSEKHDAVTHDSAIIMQPVVNVKSSPGDAGKSIFVLHEGTKASVLDKLGDWSKIEIADGRQGWVTASQIEEI